MMAGLDKVVSDLDKQEKAIYSRVRPPLEQNRPVQDSTDRLQDLRVMTSTSCGCCIRKLLNTTLDISKFSSGSRESICSFYNSPTWTFPLRTLLLLSVKLNRRSHLKYRKQRASWSQTQTVRARLNSTAKWMKPTRSTQRPSSFFSAFRTSMGFEQYSSRSLLFLSDFESFALQ